jgi:hypothetical protein
MSAYNQMVTLLGGRQTSILTQNAVSISASGTSNSAFYDTYGYSDIAVTMINDASTSSSGSLKWSHDPSGAPVVMDDTIIASNTLNRKGAITSTKARYVQVSIANGDTASHTMSAWIYLKA